MLLPILHDTPGETRPGLEVKDWKKGECELIPGKTAPHYRRRSSATIRTLYKRFTALGPLMDKLGNGGKGITWNTEHEVEHLRRPERRGQLTTAPTKGMPKIETDIDACEVILMLAPETNGEVAVKAWEALAKATGREHAHLAAAQGGREDPLPRHRGAAAQDHLVADLVGHREREGLLQRRLHQRARADPVAHADRPPAALSGSPVDAGLRRGLVRLPPAGRHSRPIKPVIEAQAATATRRSC